jgi:hypothetical protein
MNSMAETHVPPELIRFKFTPQNIELLNEYKEEWQGATRGERSKIAARAYAAMKTEHEEWTDLDKKLRKEVSSP